MNDGSILQGQIEYQLLNNTKISYSHIDGSFVFFNSSDDELNDKSIQSTNEPKPLNQSEDDTVIQVIHPDVIGPTIVERENTGLAKDDLFMIVVLKSAGYADNLKSLNYKGLLEYDDIMDSDVFSIYYCSSEVSIFNMRKSKFKDRHNVKTHLVIMSLNDISESFLIRFQLGWSLDFDVVMVNQIAFTFKR